jgi:sugar lactone lactonase YvrE
MRKLLFLALTVVLVLVVTSVLTPSYAQEVTQRVLVRGSPIHGANGIMFGPDGNLYIASVLGQEIVVMNPETGDILDRRGPDQGVDSPDDVAFGPDGSLYWTAILTGEVGRLSPEGTQTSQFVAPGVNPITFSDDGRLFVALCILGDGLYELDPDLVDPPRLIAENMGEGMCGLNGMDWGPDGFLYGPRYVLPGIFRVNVDTGEYTMLAEDIVGVALKFDSQGRLHVHDGMQVWRVDIETGDSQVIATAPFAVDNLALDSEDRLFVSGLDTGAIAEILPDGTARMVSEGGMMWPGGITVVPRPDGASVLVADFWNIREFDGLTGEEISIREAPMFGAFTVAPDGDNLVLTGWFANAVAVWNPETQEVSEYYEDFAVPLNAIRFQGDLVVAELGTASVVRASAEDPSQRVTLAEGLGVPAGLAATDDDLWVADWAAGLVLQIVAGGEPLAEPVPVATGLLFPEGLAVAPDGSPLVVETGAGRLLRIDTATGEVSAVAEGLELGAPGVEGYPPTWMFNGVAVSPSGAIYVTGDVGNVLLRLTSPPPEGTDSLTARVSIDYRCDGFFQKGLDVPLPDVPVTLDFPDGSSVTHQTRPFGLVNFSGFDASGGVTVGVTLPGGYRGYSLDSCPASPGTVSLQPDDFHFGYAFVQFGAEVLGEEAGP